MTFYDRYKDLCIKKGILPASQETAEKIGCTRSAISSFARNGSTPKGDIIAGAARLLDVTSDYLLGLTDTSLPLGAHTEVSPSELQAVKLLRVLNEEGSAVAYAMLSALADQSILQNHETPVTIDTPVE